MGLLKEVILMHMLLLKLATLPRSSLISTKTIPALLQSTSLPNTQALTLLQSLYLQPQNLHWEQSTCLLPNSLQAKTNRPLLKLNTIARNYFLLEIHTMIMCSFSSKRIQVNQGLFSNITSSATQHK